MATTLPGRKADHLRIAARADVVHHGSTGMDSVRLRHRALPGRDLAEVDLNLQLLGARLEAPLVICAMTGGTAEASAINGALAAAAQQHGLAMMLGSGRALLEDPELIDTYRSAHRPPLLLANLGGVGLEPDAAVRLVDLLDADGLSVHLNPLQEAVQPEGEPFFGDVLDRIRATVAALAPRPVLVKEVGFGVSVADAVDLAGAGVAAIDVAGSGGTNWALVEGQRDPDAQGVAAAFADWGIPTANAVRDIADAVPGLTLIASGGIADGVAAAKALALGARAAGLARPLLLAAQAGRVQETVATILRQLRIATWATGAARSVDLGPEHLA